MIKFIENTVYQTRSIGDHNCIYSYRVVSRTAKMVTIVKFDLDTGEDRGEQSKKRVSEYEGVEIFKPHGNYSMAAVISADKKSEVQPSDQVENPFVEPKFSNAYNAGYVLTEEDVAYLTEMSNRLAAYQFANENLAP